MKKIFCLLTVIVLLTIISSCDNYVEVKRKNGETSEGAEVKIVNMSKGECTFVVGASSITYQKAVASGGIDVSNIAINSINGRTIADDYIPIIVSDLKGKKRFLVEIYEPIVSIPGKVVSLSPIKWDGETFTSDDGYIKSVVRAKMN